MTESQNASQAEKFGFQKGRKPVVLLVDDDPSVTAGIKRVFRSHPYSVLTADSANAALSLLKEHDVDVVVSDYQMPGMLGTEFLARVRSSYPTVARIMLTGNTELQTAIQAINDGEIFRFVTKPCDAKALIGVIRKAAQHRELMIASRALIKKSHEQTMILRELEMASPGITQLRTDDDGVIVMPDIESSLEELLDEFER